MLLGGVWLWMGYSRLTASMAPSTPVRCGAPELASLDHIALGGCEVRDVLTEGSTFWVVLAPPDGPVSVVAAMSIRSDEVRSVAETELSRGLFDVARTEPDARDARFRSFPELSSATFVGHWRSVDESVVDGGTIAYLAFGVLFVGADLVRILLWMLRRVRGY